ncbi:transposase (IS4), partial [mine drainage metagenome]
TDKETRDIVDLVGRKDPDTIGMLEKSMAPLIVKEFGSSGLVYDLSAVRYYGTENDLAKYGHYYHSNGENREINFVLAVTRNGGIPVHHRPLAGSIPSVSTIRGFTGELKDLGIMGILVVMDRGFYSSDNLKDLKNYSVIGALPSTVGIHDDLILESRNIENSTNYFQYHEETVFMGEKRIHGIR